MPEGERNAVALPGTGPTCPLRQTECPAAECCWWDSKAATCAMLADLQLRRQLITDADRRDAERTKQRDDVFDHWRMRVFKAVGMLCGFNVDKLWATAERLCELHPDEADRIAQGADE